ncbi:hypothetical protein ACSHT0_00055 [Tepidicaulis sp. LMO-SS28]|uniref:hypothetical protein n=1 Tax=Tepidicaulis sp. LMO-SS28 TaxID=3447455 RepID=UPI003EE0A580
MSLSLSVSRILILSGLALALTACVSAEERAQMAEAQRSADRAECQNLGFEPETEAFSECLLKLREIRAQEQHTQAVERARQDYLFNGPWPYWRPYPYRYW